MKTTKRQLKTTKIKENKMKITKRQLRRIIKEEKAKLQESAQAKLSDDATGTGMNLDQELYFGLEDGIKALLAEYANDTRFIQHGVTYEDVLGEFLLVVDDMRTR